MTGNGGNDTFIGGTGTETLQGGNGNNLFVMGQGVATAFGGTGNDVYSYAAGGGSFVLNDGGGTNTLRLGQGISSAQVTLTASGTDLLIGDGTAGDQVRLVGQLSSSNKIQTLVFGDGSTMGLEGVVLTTPSGASSLYGTPGNDTLVGTGTETLTGNGGNDTFIGGTGTETLQGGNGNNLFVMGQGVATAFGGTGNDVYSYAAGGGNFVLNDAGGTNTLALGQGISSAQVTLTASGTDLLIGDGAAGDQIRLLGQLSSSNKIQTLVLGDGSTMGLEGVALSTPSGSTSLNGTPGNDTLTGGNGIETLTGNGGNDIFIAGIGTETLQGGSGNNIYSYAGGDGQVVISGSNNNSTLVLGNGLVASNLTFTISGSDLLISDGIAGDQIRLVNRAAKTVVFGDGSSESLLAGQTLTGNAGTTTLVGTAWNDMLVGGAGTETLIGNGGNDTFIAGTGAETLQGSSGSDTYSYASGDGNVTIFDNGGSNTLKLGNGLTAANVQFSRLGNYDLVLSDGVTGDKIDIQDQITYSAGYGISTLVFGDGSSINISSGVPITAVGNGIFSGAPGSDTLIGGTGTETLIGNGGNDIFIAGTGAETLQGSSGNDTYSYVSGHGNVTIYDTGGTNTLKLGSGLTASNVTFTHSAGYDLFLTDGAAGDKIDIQNQVGYSSGFGISTLVFGDGSTLNLLAGVPITASGNGSFSGTPGNDTLIGGSGIETLSSNGGNDTFIAGTGTETLQSGTGNDTYSYASGDGNVTIADSGGTNVLKLGAGLTASNVRLNRLGSYDLVLTDGTAGDQIDIQYQVGYSPGYGLSTLVFGDGSTLNLTTGLPIIASGAGVFAGTPSGDTLVGGNGSETLTGNGGNDTFIAGTGTETLQGASGNDTYSYASGDGNVTISDSGGTNTLKLGSNLTASNVRLNRSGSYDLVLTDGTAGDKIDIQYQVAYSPGYGLSTLVFGDGSTLNLTGGLPIVASGNGTFVGTPGNDTLIGGSGTETLSGNTSGAGGNDTFIAGTGAETLQGGSGNDTYSYVSGDGNVTIADSGGTNILKLDASLTSSNVTFARSGSYDLLLTDGVTGDKIDIQYQVGYPPGYGLSTLIFGDGSTLSLTGGLPIAATGNGAFVGTPGNDTLIGGSGTETLSGNTSGAGGNDTFIAGTGAETLQGSTGNDTYSYVSGDGNVTIYDTGGTNTLKLGSGLNASNVQFSRSGNYDLILTDPMTGDRIDIQNQIGIGQGYGLSTLVFGDGSILNLSAGIPLTASGNGSFGATSGNDTLTGGSGSETLVGNGGNDTFIAGNGTETLQGGSGNDTYSYASGDGNVTISDGGGTNTLALAANINRANVTVSVSGNDIVITDGVAGDQIRLSNQLFTSSGVEPNAVQTLLFSDGSTMSLTGFTVSSTNGVVNGTPGNDTLIGAAGTETLNGNGGSDTFIGASGTEWLYGNTSNGNNLFVMGQGVATAFGGSGNDVYSYAAGGGSFVISDGGGTNTLRLGQGISSAQVTLTASGTDLLIGDGTAGDQVRLVGQLSSSNKIQTLVFGDGSTMSLEGVALSTPASILNGTPGNDTLVGGSGVETLTGNGGNDTFIGGIGTETLQGGSGNNLFVMGQGAATALGGTGNDTYSYAAGDGSFVLNEGGGTNALVLGQGISSAQVMLTASGADLLIGDGTAGDQVRLVGQLSSSNKIQTLVFGDGSTLSLEAVALTTPSGATSLFGTPGNDTLTGGNSGVETLAGNGGNDTFIGGIGTETLQGGNGNNLFVMGQGVATALGGSGNDIYSYAAGGGSFVLNDGGGTNTVRLGQGISSAQVTLTASGTDLLIGDGTAADQIRLVGQLSSSNKIQTLVFGDGSTMGLEGVALSTPSGSTSLNGTPGNDTLVGGGSGVETLTGNGGNDTFIAGIGTETLQGGAGNNLYSYAGGDGQVVITGSNNNSTLVLGNGLTAANLTFTMSGSDLLIGDGIAGDQIRLVNRAAKTVVFGDGSSESLLIGQSLSAGAGTTTLVGTGWNDYLVGGTGTETLIGNGGNDTFIAGTGAETLQGSTGNDTYSYASGAGNVTIYDNGGSNTLKLGSGLTASNVQFSRLGNYDLVLTDGVTGDKIDIQYQIGYGTGYGMSTLVFGDGSSINISSGVPITAVGNGIFSGAPGSSDTLTGGTGIETLIGNGGNDTFIAGTGTETLQGASGNDTYSYASGDGNVTIYDTGGTNTLKLASGLTASNVTFVRSGSYDLLIADGVTGDKIDIQYQVGYNPGYGISTLIFGDGSTLNLNSGLPLIASGNGSLAGTPSSDTLIGGSGIETLSGNGGNDTFIAGTGTETLQGGSGNDTYSYASGDGNVTIYDTGGTNLLKLGSGLTASNVRLNRSGSYDLVLTDGVTGDRIDIQYQVGYSPGYGLSTLVFADGSTLSLTGGLPIVASGNGAFVGTPYNDTLIGGSGSETLSGNTNGAGGNDTFIAGTGAETLQGGSGNDTYSYVSGDGNVTIADTGGTNLLKLGAGLTSSNVTFARSGANDLVLTDGITGDKIDIQFQYNYGQGYGISTLVFSDGSTLALTGGLPIVATGNGAFVGTPGNDTLIGGSGTETLSGNMNGNGGNDTFIAGTGVETLQGGSGNDTYSYASGGGNVTIADTGGTNVLWLGANLTSSNVTFARSGSYDLLLTDGVTGDKIDLQFQIGYGQGYGISTLVFGDGSTLALTGGLPILATGNGAFVGTPGNDTLIGGNGTETLSGNTSGNGGNDTFIAGTGAETLQGGSGNDTYSFVGGDGNVTIADSGGTNVLKLAAGLTSSNISFVRSGAYDLILSDGIVGDSIDLQNQFNSGYGISTLIFNDGSTINLLSGLSFKANGSGSFAGTSGNDTLIGGTGTETLVGNGGRDTITGGTGVQTLMGGTGNDILTGGSGAQILVGNGGNDTFVVGTGTETLQGGSGNDIYSYAAGDGTITINDSGGTNTLALAANINRAAITVTVSGNDLLLTDGTSGDQIRLLSQLYSSNGIEPYAVQTLVFADGSTMSLTGFTVTPTTNAVINGTPGNDTLIAGAGTDTLNGNGGSDTFIGASGTEWMYGYIGSNGNNLFVMGQGAATAFGGSGNDVYSYVASDGSFVISDGGGNDTLAFGQGISAAQVTLMASGTDLLIGDGTAGDQIRLVGQLTTANTMETLVFGNGTTMSLNGVALTTPSGASILNGTPGSDTLTGGSGSETVTGNGGNDTFIGGTGTETLQGGNGNNLFVMGQGVATAFGGAGNDVYSYAAGGGIFVLNDGGGSNTLKLGQGIGSAQVTLTASGADLLIGDGTAGDQIRLVGQLSSSNKIQTLVFADGSTMSLEGVALTTPSGASSLNGTPGNDTLVGGSGVETLTGNGGNDTFIAGIGTETLQGGSGYETYSYTGGDGLVVISGSNNNSTLALGGGLVASNLTFTTLGTDLLIGDGIAGDQIKLLNHAAKTVVFADGSSESLLIGQSLIAGAGSTTLAGTIWNDTLIGGAGTETLIGNGGNDTFIAGTGTETLQGSAGNDTYSYASGSGRVAISETGGLNVLKLGNGLTRANVSFAMTGSDIVISDGVAGDQIDLMGQEAGSIHQVQKLVFSDGTTMDLTAGIPIKAIGNGTFYGTQYNDTLIGGVGTETLEGNGGTDLFIGGTGTQVLVGSFKQESTFIAGVGAETMIGDVYADLYSYSAGDGQVADSDRSGHLFRSLSGHCYRL